MEPWFTIINRHAGGGRAGRKAPAALHALRERGLVLATHETAYAGHATELAREGWKRGYRRFLSVGGDGTHYEVVNGLFPRVDGADAAEKPVIGMLPLGTGNSFLRDFGVDTLAKAIDAVAGASPRPVDVVRCEHDDGELHYINLLSLGFVASVGALTNARFKPMGAAGYALATVLSVLGLRHPAFSYAVDDDTAPEGRPCTFVSFSNSRFTGGKMMMAPDADTGDGALDVVRINPVGRARLLQAFPLIFRGAHRTMPEFEHRQARRVVFARDGESAPQVDAMVDGEVLRLGVRALEVVPGALEVMA